MRKFLIIFPMMWMTACTGLSYQEPMQGPRARVRFVTTSGGLTVLRTYNDINCTQNETEWMRLRVGYVPNSDLKTLGLPLWSYHKNSAKEVFVEANRPITGMFFGAQTIGATRYSCGTPFSFSFLEENDYEVKFQWNPSRLEPYPCQTIISKFVRDGEKWYLTEMAKFDNQINKSNSGCLDQFRRVRLLD